MKKLGLTLLIVGMLASSLGVNAGCGCSYVDVPKSEWAPKHDEARKPVHKRAVRVKMAKKAKYKAPGKSGKAYHKAVKRQMKAKGKAIEVLEAKGHRAASIPEAMVTEEFVMETPDEMAVETGDIFGDLL